MKQNSNVLLEGTNNVINHSSNSKIVQRGNKQKYHVNKKSRQRQDNSLDELTKAFIEYVCQSGEKHININDVVKKLKVKKRRIYDITNVLEGIGYIKKEAKNQITWLKTDMFSSFEDNKSTTKEEKENLQQELIEENDRLTSYLQEVHNSLETIKSSEEFKNNKFLTFDDLKSVAKDDNANLIAIQTPSGTKIDQPNVNYTELEIQQAKCEVIGDKEDIDSLYLESLNKQYQLFFDSEEGSINLYLILSKNNNDNKSIAENQFNSLSSSTSKVLRTNINDNNLLLNSKYGDF